MKERELDELEKAESATTTVQTTAVQEIEPARQAAQSLSRTSTVRVENQFPFISNLGDSELGEGKKGGTYKIVLIGNADTRNARAKFYGSIADVQANFAASCGLKLAISYPDPNNKFLTINISNISSERINGMLPSQMKDVSVVFLFAKDFLSLAQVHAVAGSNERKSDPLYCFIKDDGHEIDADMKGYLEQNNIQIFFPKATVKQDIKNLCLEQKDRIREEVTVVTTKQSPGCVVS